MAQAAANPLRDGDQELVADGVAEAVVDDLEVVQVEEEAGQDEGFFSRLRDRFRF